MSGPCLTDAAPETAPGGLFVRGSRYAEARTSTSAVTAAVCIGGISTSLLCYEYRRPVGRHNQCLADDRSCQHWTLVSSFEVGRSPYLRHEFRSPLVFRTLASLELILSQHSDDLRYRFLMTCNHSLKLVTLVRHLRQQQDK